MLWLLILAGVVVVLPVRTLGELGRPLMGALLFASSILVGVVIGLVIVAVVEYREGSK